MQPRKITGQQLQRQGLDMLKWQKTHAIKDFLKWAILVNLDLVTLATKLQEFQSSPDEKGLKTVVTLFMRERSGQDAPDALKQLQPVADSFIRKLAPNRIYNNLTGVSLSVAPEGATDVLQLFVTQFLSDRESVNTAKHRGIPLLHCLARYGYTEFMQLLIENKADVNITDEFAETPLHYAAKYRQNKAAQLLLAHGADAKAKNDIGLTYKDLPVNFRQQRPRRTRAITDQAQSGR